MNRCQSAESGEEPSEDALLEAELAALQRRYRTMQNDYRAYKELTKRVFNKQNLLITSLEGEQVELATWMSKMETTQNKSKDKFNIQQLRRLSSTTKKYASLINEEKDKIKDLDGKIKSMWRRIVEQRQQMGGVHNSAIQYNANKKSKCILENRLDKSMVHFNKQLANNTQLRQDIDHLRRERAVFDNLYKKLAKELDSSKKEMCAVIENATQAFEQRDEAQNKMTALLERNEKDTSQHMSEMKELQRHISHDDRIKQFMLVKASDRNELKAEEAEKKRLIRGDNDKGTNADIASIKAYEEAFKKICDVTKEDDLNVIVENFIRTEDENFALFNYVNEVTTEVETLMEMVARKREDIEKFKEQDKQIDSKHETLVNKLEADYNEALAQSEASEKRLKEVNKVLSELMSQIEAIFRRAGCDARPIQEMLGTTAINPKNVMIYMGLIEQKTTELLNIRSYLHTKKSEIQGGIVPAQGLNLPPPNTQMAVPPAPTGEEEEEEDEDGEADIRPLTDSQLRLKVMRGLARRSLSQSESPQKTAGPARDKKKKGK